KVAEENGASLICIHGRTREQMYAPPVDLDTIAAVKRAVSIPVIGNGGIETADDAMEMLDKTGCDGLMIARGAMGNPWLFEEIAARMEGKSYRLPDLDVRLAEALAQVDDMIADKGVRVGVLEARRQLAYYIKGVSGAAEVRNRLNAAETVEEIHAIVSRWLRN
ncbi:MAG: tRNA-dihydrouridine synthase, partial [Clostridia bacterium]|nr:tRNA-dihydrouridine synthase [Clostridia bacterium]